MLLLSKPGARIPAAYKNRPFSEFIKTVDMTGVYHSDPTLRDSLRNAETRDWKYNLTSSATAADWSDIPEDEIVISIVDYSGSGQSCQGITWGGLLKQRDVQK